MTNGDLTRWEEILDSTLILKSNLKPSEWYESNMFMPAGDPFPGPIRYDRTPYWREVVDCTDPNHPARDITIIGPAQMGKSIMVLNAVVGYTIAMDPCNVLFLTGHSDLSREAMMKLDFMIKNCGLDPLIMPQVLKAKNNRTGDTMTKKEYRGGDLKAGSITNHNLLRQNTVKKSIADDLDAGELAKDKTGSTIEKIKTRTKAHENTCKRLWVSTPQKAGYSLIEIQLKNSDRRNWMVQCPHCGNSENRITLEMPFKVNDTDMAGLTWKLDPLGRVDFKSVGYICQKCSRFFDDRDKHELLNSGIWVPTQEAMEPYHQGYEINGLYAPHGMTSWYTLASKYVLLNPPGLPRKEKEWQTYWNDDIGKLYSEPKIELKATELQKNNVREYAPGELPIELSRNDGNGEVVMITLEADCNGKLEDARLDWELEAWTETGARYSLDHGSIGTFIPNQSQEQKEADSREKWSYELHAPNSVWPEFHKKVSGLHGGMGVFITAIDTGHCYDQVFSYIDANTPAYNIVGVMGDKEHEWQKYRDVKDFTPGKSRLNLYLLNVNKMKDDLARQMQLKWDPKHHKAQPYGFMNFPLSRDGKYDFKHYFSHFEAEEKRDNADKGEFIWEKKGPIAQNHFWDVKIYGTAARDILMEIICKKEMKLKTYNWKIFVDILMGRPISE